MANCECCFQIWKKYCYIKNVSDCAIQFEILYIEWKRTRVKSAKSKNKLVLNYHCSYFNTSHQLIICYLPWINFTEFNNFLNSFKLKVAVVIFGKYVRTLCVSLATLYYRLILVQSLDWEPGSCNQARKMLL